MIKNYRTKSGQQIFINKLNEYFEMCDALNLAAEKEKHAPKPYTLSGLLFHLDMSETELYELEKESRTLKKAITSAKRKIEAYIEENALNGKLTSTAAINSLKEHFGWNEKKDEDPVSGIEITLDDTADMLGS